MHWVTGAFHIDLKMCLNVVLFIQVVFAEHAYILLGACAGGAGGDAAGGAQRNIDPVHLKVNI
jgi:hypothetical protein